VVHSAQEAETIYKKKQKHIEDKIEAGKIKLYDEEEVPFKPEHLEPELPGKQ
jgi:hypothetical protein